MNLWWHKRVFAFYLLIQIIIWVKVYFFFQWFGYGQVAIRAPYLPQNILIADLLFHQLMHVLIAVAAFVFGKQLHGINEIKLGIIVLVAVVLHNAGYWFTRVYTTPYAIISDFLNDVVLLYSFIVMSHYFAKKHLFLKKLKFPFIY